MICILGRQPAIGRAELEALYGADVLLEISEGIIRVDSDVDIARLGGTVKTARLIDEVNFTGTRELVNYCKKALPDYVSTFPDGKIKAGLSFYGLEQNVRAITAAGLEIKKVLKNLGRSVRVVPNQSPVLSSAQTLHNQLTSPLGLELAFIRHGNKTIIAHVAGVQNIEAYTLRDRGRPKRDSRVGMLPPKLAQIIINLAVGSKPLKKGYSVLDPFCGTGVVLQEALLMGYPVHGSDIDQRMVSYTDDNLDWLRQQYPQAWEVMPQGVSLGDATSAQWEYTRFTFNDKHGVIDERVVPLEIGAVACEGYLGTPFASEPPEGALRDSIMTCNLIMKKFLKNIHSQLETGTRLCVAAPAWFVRAKIHHLPLLDDLENLGYNRIDFEFAAREDLIYHREDQVVGRELLVLIRK